jgi:hypothetical protein
MKIFQSIGLTAFVVSAFFVAAQADDPAVVSETSKTKKDWNFMVYMVNNNNLYSEGLGNFRQMAHVGSSEFMDILIQMDKQGEQAFWRFWLAQGEPVVLEGGDNTASSGTPQNLYDFFKESMTERPAKAYLLDLWNHGAGIKDPHIWGRKIINYRDDLFVFDPLTKKLHINREMPYNKMWHSALRERRGIAFNDQAKEYLTNQDLKNCLDQISSELLGGKKIDILAMDACHMAMLEIAYQVKDAASYIVASEEVEPGSGYNYAKVLSPFAEASMTTRGFCQHIVDAYKDEYDGTIADYTQSAMDLSCIEGVTKHLSFVASALKDVLEKGGKKAVKAIHNLRMNDQMMTEFVDVDYIDLGHFLESLIEVSHDMLESNDKWFTWPFTANTENEDVSMAENLNVWEVIIKESDACLKNLKEFVFANVCGMNLSHASGVSIYFPVKKIDTSYEKTEFAKDTTWLPFLKAFVQSRFIDTESPVGMPHKTGRKVTA